MGHVGVMRLPREASGERKRQTQLVCPVLAPIIDAVREFPHQRNAEAADRRIIERASARRRRKPGRVERRPVVLDREHDIGGLADNAGDDLPCARFTPAMLHDVGDRLLEAQLERKGRLLGEPGCLARPHDPFRHAGKLARVIAQGER